MSHQVQFQYDPDIGYRFVPGLRIRVPTENGGYLVQTNSSGFRCRHEFTDTPGEGPRLLLFGDSFTAGDSVSNPVRYGDVLEQMLPPLSVWNFGLSGTGTDQQYIIWDRVARRYASDAVVITVLVENIRRIMSSYRPQTAADGTVFLQAKPYFELQGDELVRKFDPVPREPLRAADLEGDTTPDHSGRFRELRAVVGALGLKGLVQRMTRFQPTPEYDSPDDPAWRLMRAILATWRRALPAGLPVIVMPMPLYHHVEQTADASAYRKRFRELAGDIDVVLHDPLDDLLAHDAATRRSFRFGNDPHLTPAGHRAVARSLAATVARVLNLTVREQEA